MEESVLVRLPWPLRRHSVRKHCIVGSRLVRPCDALPFYFSALSPFSLTRCLPAAHQGDWYVAVGLVGGAAASSLRPRSAWWTLTEVSQRA